MQRRRNSRRILITAGARLPGLRKTAFNAHEAAVGAASLVLAALIMLLFEEPATLLMPSAARPSGAGVGQNLRL